MNSDIKTILWDFGGVFTTSPFEAFARFERERGLPSNFIRDVNTRNNLTNAWAQFESNKITREEFDTKFEEESAEMGHPVRGAEVLMLLSGQVRPRMVQVLKQCKQHFAVGCITNNMKPAASSEPAPVSNATNESSQIMQLFDTIVESSVEGVRKPDPRIYEIACNRLNCSPNECVFLDDLGINLKPARAMGMITIKVVDPDEAIDELSVATGLTFP